MEKLELKHLAPYLPYGLKGILTNDKRGDFEGEDYVSDIEIFNKGSIWTICGYAESDLCIPLGEGYFEGFLWKNENTYTNFYNGIKPILHPLSDLTKEIEVNGERFVPIIKLKNFDENITFYNNDIYYEKEDWSIYLFEDIRDYLLQWHFDLFGLIEKGLAIDFNLFESKIK